MRLQVIIVFCCSLCKQSLSLADESTLVRLFSTQRFSPSLISLRAQLEKRVMTCDTHRVAHAFVFSFWSRAVEIELYTGLSMSTCFRMVMMLSEASLFLAAYFRISDPIGISPISPRKTHAQ